MNDVPPFVAMMQMLSGFQLSQALYTMAELDVPGLLLDGPRTVEELADATGADADALRRVIRFLETAGVFRVNDGTVEVTDLGATLADGTPGSVRGLARYWMETHYAPFGDLMHTVRTGETAATRHLGKPFFDWVTESPRLVELQNAGMAAGGNGMRDAALAGYRLPGTGTVADVGGADGNVLSQLLAADPERRGIVFDLPEVVAGAHPVLAAAGLTDRVRVVGGDFFEAVPAADVYVMSVILHDWDEEKCLRILRNIAKAAPSGARLVLLEMVVPEDASPHPSKSIDLVMLAMLGGRERTAAEWRDLLEAGGFSLDRVIVSPSPFSVIEATLR
jgi:O-methyltransferase domain